MVQFHRDLLEYEYLAANRNLQTKKKKSQNCVSFQRNVALNIGNVVVTSCLLQMVALHELMVAS